MSRARIAAPLIVVSAALLAASPASAVDRHASPTGTGADPCSAGDPCSLLTAVETVALDGDRVLLAPGDYDLGGEDLSIDDEIVIEPSMPGTRPRISTDAPFGISTIFPSVDVTLRDLWIEGDPNTSSGAVLVQGGTTTLERVIVHHEAETNSQGIAVRSMLVMRNSAVYIEGVDAHAVDFNVFAVYGYGDSSIRNSTLIAEGTGSPAAIVAASPAVDPTPYEIEVVNTIAWGADTGIRADDGTGTDEAEVTVNVSYSNTSGLVDDPPDAAIVEGPGNQSEAPLLANPAAGAFAQLFGSPTVNAGVNDDTGSLDLYSGARVVEGRTDIGADELVPPRCRGASLTMLGTGAGEVITGTASRDVIAALAGNDVIKGLGANDLICAGSGNDRVLGGSGHDLVLGEGGRDRLLGNVGRDRLLGNAGPDRLFGGIGPDRLFGGGGPDRLFGGIGPDRLFGGGGPDRLFGNAGRDRLFGQGGRDLLIGGSHRDRLRGGPGRDRQRQ